MIVNLHANCVWYILTRITGKVNPQNDLDRQIMEDYTVSGMQRPKKFFLFCNDMGIEYIISQNGESAGKRK